MKTIIWCARTAYEVSETPDDISGAIQCAGSTGVIMVHDARTKSEAWLCVSHISAYWVIG